MKVLSSHCDNGKWIETKNTPEETAISQRDTEKEEIKRVLSDAFRCKNLVILTGLGASLHVNCNKDTKDTRTPENGKKIAPTMGDLWDKSMAKSAGNFEKILAASRFPENEADKKNIEALLSYCKIAAEFIELPDKDVIDTFVSDTEKIIRDEINFLETDNNLPVHAELLRRIARRSNRKIRTKIFTTNYDLCFEYAARKGRYVVIDGFSHTSPQVFDSINFSYDIVKRESHPESHDYISNVFHLYKLHGSIDWEKNETTKEIKRVQKTKKPVLIYPRNTKYELAFEQPYLEMMSAFQTALRQPETALLVVGFGFNDSHLAEPIISAIRSNLNLRVVICDPALAPRGEAKGATESNEYLKDIAYLIAQGDARLSLINATFEEMVPYLPDIVAETDLEQHLDRLRKLREESGNSKAREVPHDS